MKFKHINTPPVERAIQEARENPDNCGAILLGHALEYVLIDEANRLREYADAHPEVNRDDYTRNGYRSFTLNTPLGLVKVNYPRLRGINVREATSDIEEGLLKSFWNDKSDTDVENAGYRSFMRTLKTYNIDF